MNSAIQSTSIELDTIFLPMTDSDARREYNAQGQQDDYFDEDITIAGYSSPQPVATDENNQGQQDDYFTKI